MCNSYEDIIQQCILVRKLFLELRNNKKEIYRNVNAALKLSIELSRTKLNITYFVKEEIKASENYKYVAN
jgi:hypothetical protein